MFSSKAKENVTAQAQPFENSQPFENFEGVVHGLFNVSKKELDAKLAEDKAKRLAERQHKRRQRQESQK